MCTAKVLVETKQSKAVRRTIVKISLQVVNMQQKIYYLFYTRKKIKKSNFFFFRLV